MNSVIFSKWRTLPASKAKNVRHLGKMTKPTTSFSQLAHAFSQEDQKRTPPWKAILWRSQLSIRYLLYRL